MASTQFVVTCSLALSGLWWEQAFAASWAALVLLMLHSLRKGGRRAVSLRVATMTDELPPSTCEESALRCVFKECAECFCVYQRESVQICSKAMAAVLGSLPEKFWQQALSASDFAAFERAVLAAESGVPQRLQLRLGTPERRASTRIVPLSPILESLSGSEHWNSRADVAIRRTYWHGEVAVLIKISQSAPSHSAAADFAKTLNHEFRTPLNIIIGLSDLILADLPGEVACGRLRLLRQCAATFLAAISSIVHQCEVLWSLPTAVCHSSFVPSRTVRIAVNSARDRLAANGNHVELFLKDLPQLLWGSGSQFRHTLCFLLQSCSLLMHDQEIMLQLTGHTSQYKCDLHGVLQGTCAVQVAESDFQSVLQLFSLPFDPVDDTWTETLKKTESQAMLHFSIAREMCRLLFGDLHIIDTEPGKLRVEFSFCFSTRGDYILKRKGNIYPDEELLVRIPEVRETLAAEDDSLLSDTPSSRGTRERTNTCLRLPLASDPEFPMRRSKTVRSSLASFSTWSWLACEQERYTFRSMTHASLKVQANGGDWESPVLNDCSPQLVHVDALIADDVPSNALILQQMLRRLHISSEIVTNGAEAVSFVQQCVPRVVFMDCEMPVMGGLEATRLLRGMQVTVPIVAVTANGPEKEKECLAAGMTYFLSKPVAFRTLEALVDSLQTAESAY